MRQFPQTILQLIEELVDQDFTQEDIELVGSAYRLAMSLSGSQFRSSGKTLLAHLVGTAGILARAGAPARTVAAALLHNAYLDGPDPQLKQRLRASVGPGVEALVAAFGNLVWNPETIEQFAEHIEKASSSTRHAIVIRLANEVEEHLDMGMHYSKPETSEKLRERYQRCGTHLQSLARNLDYPQMSDWLQSIEECSISRCLDRRVEGALSNARLTPLSD